MRTAVPDDVLRQQGQGGDAGEHVPAVGAPRLVGRRPGHPEDECHAAAGEHGAGRPHEGATGPERQRHLEDRAGEDRRQDLRHADAEPETELPEDVDRDDDGGDVQPRIARVRQDHGIRGPAERQRPCCHAALRTSGGDRHRPVGREEERRQMAGEVGERQHVRVQLDPERLLHERAAGLDSGPGVRVAGGERRPQRLVGQRQPVLDVRREVRRARRRDDVALQSHARPQLDGRAGEHGRADPLVEVELVTRVEEDAEELVAEMAVDDLLQGPAHLADVQRAVPLGDRLEVRRDQPLDVVGGPVRERRRRPRRRSRRGS